MYPKPLWLQFYVVTDQIIEVVYFRRDGLSLERFLDDYFARRLKRYVKSEPVPERNTAAVKVSQTLRT